MRRLVIGALAAAMALGGCGIPDDTPAVPIGAGPSFGTSAGGEAAPPLPRREAADKPAQLVLDYLQAAAGDPDGALARVKAFLSPRAAAAFKPPLGVHVVAMVGDPLNNPGSDDVSVRVRQVGTLGNNGILDPSTDSTLAEYRFVVQRVREQSGLFVTEPPPMMLLSVDALQRYYDLRTIYFWNAEHTALVPDVRYMPKSVPPEQRPTEVLTWLIAGPSTWLTDDAVEPLPAGTASIGNVPAVSNEKLQINLSVQGAWADDKNAVDRIRQQLMWSLRPYLPRFLELKIGHKVVGDWDQTDFLSSNASYRLADQPERFAVVNGQIRRLKSSAYAGEDVPVLTPAANRNIKYAALSSSDAHTYAAVVVDDGDRTTLQVAGAVNGGQAPLRKVEVPGTLGHPVWAVTPEEPPDGAIGLITAGGRLYRFAPTGGRAQIIDWPGGGPPEISAVAVAPDAHRVALVVGGHLYLSVLSTGGGGVQLGAPQEIPTPMSQVTAVDWSSEGWLVVGGTRKDTVRVAIMDMTIDGALTRYRLKDLGTEQVSYLTSYPARPVPNGRETSGSVAYVAGGAAYDVLADATRITAADLAPPVANPPSGAVPTAPLFLH